jgi:uncharacterized protein (TIGR03437 family)
VKVGRVFSLSHWSKFGVTACLCVAYAAQAQTITGIITTIAGNGTQGFAGDGSSALNANMNLPFAAVLAGGNLYIADQVNCVVRVVNSSGAISTFAGTTACGYSGDGGKATSAQLSKFEGIAVDSSGNVYIGDTGNNLVRKVSTSGIITTFAGTPGTSGYGGDGGGAAGAFLKSPAGLAFDSAGNLYIADSGNNVIRKVAASTGTITTYAGNAAIQPPAYSGNGGPATKAGLNAPVAVWVDVSGNLYIADSNNNVVRKVSTNLIISTVAGNGTPGFSGDGGNPAFAQLSHPKGVAVDSVGNVYIADTLNSRIRLVAPNGTIINTVIGTGQPAYFGDNGPGLQAAVNFPAGLSFDGSGNLIIADTNNSVIRKFAPGGSSGSKPVISAGGVITPSQYGESSTIAPGAWIEIYGSNLANTTTDWSNSFQGTSPKIAPTTLGGTTVTIGGLNTVISYVSPIQVDVQAPFGLTPGSQAVVVSTAAGQSANYNVNVANASPGLYAPSIFSVGGKQYVGATHQDGTWVMPAGAVAGFTSSPAKAGETITLFGVGFGQVNPTQPDGQTVQNLNSLTTALTMFFGPAQGTLTYQGLAPNFIGLYQFNVTVPNVASGNLVLLTFILGNSPSAQTLYTAVQ